MVNGRAARAISVLLTGMSAAALSGCVNFSAMDNLETAPPPTNAFNLALYQDYAFLAHSFGNVGQAGYTSFDQSASYSLTSTAGDVAGLANTFAAKALQLSKGLQVDPEPSRDVQTHEIRDRLVRALHVGRESFPRDAARAQADFDCWQLDGAAPQMAAAAAQCRRSLDVSLARLEAEVKTVPQKAPPKGEQMRSSQPVLDEN